ncbi:MAG: COX15/CtaA family protein, partial [Pseudomonas marincola]
CLIFMALVWTALDLLYPQKRNSGSKSPLNRLAGFCLMLVFIQILIGGLVAGLNAGFIYNEWPLMGGRFIPEDLLHLSPWYMNFLENPTAVQFSHRIMAYITFAAIFGLFIKSRNLNVSALNRRVITALFGAVLLQVALGIWTLVAVVPVTLGALHQAGGMIVLGVAIFSWHQSRFS